MKHTFIAGLLLALVVILLLSCSRSQVSPQALEAELDRYQAHYDQLYQQSRAPTKKEYRYWSGQYQQLKAALIFMAKQKEK